MNVQYMRLLHYGALFGFIGFFIHHLYSAVLTAHEERNGLMESIFTGYKLVSPDLVKEELSSGKEQRSIHLLPRKRGKKG
jgi:Ni/Fe-hydrogenase 1 B-type cytochrome subunit